MIHELEDLRQYAEEFLRAQREFVIVLEDRRVALSSGDAKEIVHRIRDISEVVGMLTLALQRSFDPGLSELNEQLIAIRDSHVLRLTQVL